LLVPGNASRSCDPRVIRETYARPLDRHRPRAGLSFRLRRRPITVVVALVPLSCYTTVVSSADSRCLRV